MTADVAALVARLRTMGTEDRGDIADALEAAADALERASQPVTDERVARSVEALNARQEAYRNDYNAWGVDYHAATAENVADAFFRGWDARAALEVAREAGR